MLEVGGTGMGPGDRATTPGPTLLPALPALNWKAGNLTEKLLFLFLVALLVPYFTAPTNGILLLKHYEIPGPVLPALSGEFNFL
jgi:hypothetical protein